MDENVRDCLVTGYQSLISSLELPDPNDRHVLAAAIKAQAELIITWNTKDFPPEVLQPYGVKTQDPDEFIQDLLELSKAAVLNVMEKHRQVLKNPALTSVDYCKHLERQKLHTTVAHVRNSWGL